MKKIKKTLRIALSDHTTPQKFNYIKYLFSRKRDVLGHDPVTISIVATGRCTLSCNMCPTHSRIVPKDYKHSQKSEIDMTLDMFKEIIDRFYKATTVHIIGSGEPLLNKDFFNMVGYAANKKMIVKTFSNGTTIKDNINKILGSKLEGITISINSDNSNDFKRITGMDEGVYSNIYEGVDRLIKEKKRRASKVRIKLSFIIDKINYRSIPGMIKMAIGLGVDHAFFCNFLPSPYKGLSAKERVLTAEDNIIKELKEIFNKCPDSFKHKVTPPVLVDVNSKNNNCDTHFEQIRFDGDGNVSSCSMMLLNMTGHGNFRDLKVWNNNFFKEMRRAFLRDDLAFIEDPCKLCPDNKGVNI